MLLALLALQLVLTDGNGPFGTDPTDLKSDWGRCRIDDERTIVKCSPREKWKKLDREYN